MKILMSAFRCARNAKSESYVGYNWVDQVSRIAETTVVTSDVRATFPNNIQLFRISESNSRLRTIAPKLYGAAKPDYFLFDIKSYYHLRKVIDQFDIFHHVVPMAPRYPSALGRVAKRFVLGPVGGGLRVPPALRRNIESKEPWYSGLRNLDQLRFSIDPFLRKTYDRADVLLLTADYMRDIVPAKYHKKATYILETGINPLDYLNCSPVREKRDFVEIIYVGRLVPYKGLHFLLNAMRAVSNGVRHALKLTVIGDYSSNYGTYCRELTQKLGLTDQVTYLGQLSKESVQARYRVADIFCFPTLAETSGNVILEAMASALPILSVRHGGPAAIVNSECGILCDATSAGILIDELAEGISRLACDDDLRASMAGSAQRRAITEYSWDRKGDAMLEIYQSLA